MRQPLKTKEVEADGLTAVLDSWETLESVKFMVGFWKDAHDEGGLAWDDSSNNRAFIAGTICATSNAASIYIEALRKPDQYLTEKGTPLKGLSRALQNPRHHHAGDRCLASEAWLSTSGGP